MMASDFTTSPFVTPKAPEHLTGFPLKKFNPRQPGAYPGKIWLATYCRKENEDENYWRHKNR